MVEPLEELINRMADERVVPVVGAGFSKAVAQMPDWPTALRNMAKLVRDTGAAGVDADQVEQLLDAKLYEQAAEQLQKAQRDAAIYPAFLRQSFHRDALPDPVPPLLTALTSLPVPFMLTTNYDRLLEMGSGLHSAVWDEPTRLMIALNDGGSVVHLHGIYDKPDTVVLSASDYNALGGNDTYAAFMRSIWMQQTLLFIGSSAEGLTDTDFSALWRWAGKTFPEMPFLHYALTRAGTVTSDTRQKLLRESRVQVIEYGGGFEDLPIYLTELRERALARQHTRALTPANRTTAAVAPTPAVATVSPMPAVTLRPLTPEELETLITAFAYCEALATADNRNLLRNLLPRDIRFNVPVSNVLLQDVTGLVTTSLKYKGGFQELLRRVRFREGPTYSRDELDSIVVELFPALQPEIH